MRVAVCDGNYTQETKGRGFKCAYALSRHRGATELARPLQQTRMPCVMVCKPRGFDVAYVFDALKMREELYMVKHVKIKRFAFTFFQL